MSEPRTRAEQITELPGGALHWSIHDERIDYRSEAYAVPGARGWVLIDPLPLVPPGRTALGTVEACCITGAFHQRASWGIGAPVWAPLGAEALDREPDIRYETGALLPGALRACPSIGPGNPHVLLRWSDEEGQEVLFAGDLVVRGPDGALRLVPPDHQSDPDGLRASVREVAGWPIDRLYPAHGEPLLEGVGEALEALVGGFDRGFE